MKKNIYTLLFFAIFLFSNSAKAQTYFYLDLVSISPSEPTSVDEVFVTIQGNKSTPCPYLEYFDIAVSGLDINIDMCWADTTFACTQVLDPWETTVSLGFLSAGQYTITLGGCNHNGIGNTITFEVTGDVTPPPVAMFEFSDVHNCGSTIVEFSNLSQNADSWLWDFGDGNLSTEENPVYTYETAGTYSVTLTATNSSTLEENTFVFDGIVVWPEAEVDLGDDLTITTMETHTLEPLSGTFVDYLWSTTETSNSIEVDGNLLGVGTFIYEIIVTDANGCVAMDQIEITVELDPLDNVQNVIEGLTLEIYPNPTNDFVNVEMVLETSMQLEFTIFNSIGEVVLEIDFASANGMNNQKIDLSALSAGIYFFKINNEAGAQFSRRIIKK